MSYKGIRKLLISIITLTLFYSFIVLAQDGDITIPEFEYHNFQLDNGLEVFVFEDDSIPLVELSIFYKAGSIDEEKGLTGISHFLEHTMFLGTEALGKGKMGELIKAVGGDNNAATSFDHTYYYQEVPSSMLELAMAIEADRMGNLIIDPEEIEREREVISQERRTRIENNVITAGVEIIQATAFPESSLDHQIIGWMEDIKNIGADDIRAYYENYYVPNNAILVVAGDVELEEVKKLTEKYFAHYERREVKRPDFIVDKQEEEIVTNIELITNIPFTFMLYKIPEGNHPDIMGINIFLDILVNSQSSRIKQELQKKENLILETGTLLYDMRVPGFALVYFVPLSEDLIQIAQEAFDRELARIIEEVIEDEEFQAVKKTYEKGLVFMQRD
ncbi:MAG: insulinase family protein, partial [Halanaerobiaceae bacterium]|nr:insulinase family protein [Halanaerobiaceae bacterium]